MRLSKIDGTRLSPIEYALPVPSAQVKSSVLLAGLFADGVTSVVEPVAHARPHRTRTGRIWRAHRSRGPRDSHSRAAAPRRAQARGSWRSFVRGFLSGRGDGASGIEPRDPKCRPESHAFRRAGCSGFDGSAPSAWSRFAARTGSSSATLPFAMNRCKGGVLEGDAIAQLIDELPAIAVLGPYTEAGN